MNNQKRYLSQVLSLDAWHDKISTDSGSSVHVELSFHSGRLGGDNSEFPFTFNISLRKALLSVEVEHPLEIDRRTIARSIPGNQAELTKIIDTHNVAKSNASFGGKISPASMHVSASGSMQLDSQVSQEEKMKIIQAIPGIIAIPKPVNSQSYSWELIPGHSESLDGQPWHPVDEPRLKTLPAKKKSKLSPSVKIKLSCLLEDINITDLKLKDERPIAIIKEMAINKMNMKAAIQHLKLSLGEMQLEAGQLDDRFSRLLIADMLASEV